MVLVTALHSPPPAPPPPLKPRGDRVEWCEKQSSTLPLGGDHVDMV